MSGSFAVHRSRRVSAGAGEPRISRGAVGETRQRGHEREGEMHTVANGGPGVLQSVRRRVLEELERRGPLGMGELTAGWPLTRQQLRLVVLALGEEGLVAYAPAATSGIRRVVLTPRGRDALAA